MIKVAVLWLINEKHEYLLAKRALHKKQDPGVWGPSVTGKLEKGESADKALLRETQEELSLSPDQYRPEFLTEIPFSHPDGEQRVFTIYKAHVPSSILDDIKIDENEVASVEWRSIEKINETLSFHPEELVPSAQAVWPFTFKAIKAK